MKVNDVTILIVLQHISRYGIYCNAECLFMATDIPMSILSHCQRWWTENNKPDVIVNIFFGGQGTGICIKIRTFTEAQQKHYYSYLIRLKFASLESKFVVSN